MQAANGANVPLAGETDVTLTIGPLSVNTPVLVSEHVSEGILGLNWLTQNNCKWTMQTGRITIRGKRFQLTECKEPLGCNRIVVDTQCAVPARSEALLPTIATFGHLRNQVHHPVEFLTKESNGEDAHSMYVARGVIPHHCRNITVRVLNTSDTPITLQKGDQVALLEAVDLISTKSPAPIPEENWQEFLLAGIDQSICREAKEAL